MKTIKCENYGNKKKYKYVRTLLVYVCVCIITFII